MVRQLGGRHVASAGDRWAAAVVLLIGALVVVGGVGCAGMALAGFAQPAQPPLATIDPIDPIGPIDQRARVPADAARVTGPVLPPSDPVSLSIPAISVQVPLIRLGLRPDGSLQVPPPGPHYDDAGWYQNSPTPGTLGPSVIVGHVDSTSTGPSVFYRLGSLRPHDTVFVARVDGSIAAFTVDDVHRYHKTAFPTRLVYGDTDHAALRLITCGGPFDSNTGHYRDNIVVLASLTGATPRHPAAALVTSSGRSASDTVLARSETYSDQDDALAAARSVTTGAATAPVEDLTTSGANRW